MWWRVCFDVGQPLSGKSIHLLSMCSVWGPVSNRRSCSICKKHTHAGQHEGGPLIHYPRATTQPWGRGKLGDGLGLDGVTTQGEVALPLALALSLLVLLLSQCPHATSKAHTPTKREGASWATVLRTQRGVQCTGAQPANDTWGGGSNTGGSRQGCDSWRRVVQNREQLLHSHGSHGKAFAVYTPAKATRGR